MASLVDRTDYYASIIQGRTGTKKRFLLLALGVESLLKQIVAAIIDGKGNLQNTFWSSGVSGADICLILFLKKILL